MRMRGAARVGGVAVVAALLLAGCTSGSDKDKTDDSVVPGSAAKTAAASDGVLVEQTVDVPSHGDTASHGGTMTVTIRSVVASEGRTVLSWAVRWDDPDATAGAIVEQDDFTLWSTPPVLVDGTALEIYYPLCPGRGWHYTVDEIFCRADALFMPRESSGVEFANHQTVEAWAVFPEVGKDTETVDLVLPAGLPGFSELPVTRP